MDDKKEYYYLQHADTKYFLKGFKGNKPLWKAEMYAAVAFEELEALRLQRKLETMYMPHHKILLIEKK